MIDNLSNAMFNPVFYPGRLGALLSPRVLDGDAAGRGGPGPRGAGEDSGRAWGRAEELEGRAASGDGDWVEVARAWSHAIEEAPACGLDDRDLAAAQGRLGLALARLGRWREAIGARGRALELLAAAAARHPEDVATTGALAAEMDALARLLCTAEDPADRDPRRAVQLASQAARMAPALPSRYTTLGAALLRAGDWPAAVAAIGRAIALDRRGGSCPDPHILAIAHAPRRRGGSLALLREAELRPPGPGPGPPELGDLHGEALRWLAAGPEDSGGAAGREPPLSGSRPR